MLNLRTFLIHLDKILLWGIIIYFFITIFDFCRYQLGFVGGYPKEYLENFDLFWEDTFRVAIYMVALYGAINIAIDIVECIIREIHRKKNL